VLSGLSFLLTFEKFQLTSKNYISRRKIFEKLWKYIFWQLICKKRHIIEKIWHLITKTLLQSLAYYSPYLVYWAECSRTRRRVDKKLWMWRKTLRLFEYKTPRGVRFSVMKSSSCKGYLCMCDYRVFLQIHFLVINNIYLLSEYSVFFVLSSSVLLIFINQKKITVVVMGLVLSGQYDCVGWIYLRALIIIAPC
jgi:hypothetical protein